MAPEPHDTATQRAFTDFRVGDTASLARVISAADVAKFVELSGDTNPVHGDPRYAQGLGLGGTVVHGQLTAAFVSTLIGTVLPGPGALWISERFTFRAPVRVGDTIRVEATIRRISEATRVLVLDVAVQNQDNRVVLDGEAHVQFLEQSDTARSSGVAETAVVTGGGRGIGAAIAQRLAVAGLRVVVNFHGDAAQADETVAVIREQGGSASSFRADIRDPGDVERLFEYANSEIGRVDILVNNAGGPIDGKPIRDVEWADVEGHLATHLKGSVLCVRSVLPGMIERGFGRIVNVTSEAAYGTPPARMTGYVVAKAALAAFTHCIAVEAGAHGVTANAVAPGMTDTRLVSDVGPRAKMTVAAQTPMRRLALVEDVADAVAFLVSGAGAYVTGQTLHVSGGRIMT